MGILTCGIPGMFLGPFLERSWDVPGTSLECSCCIPGMLPSGQGWAGCSLAAPATYFGISKVLCCTFRKTDLHTGGLHRLGLAEARHVRMIMSSYGSIATIAQLRHIIHVLLAL
jgi:hypothetical protein